MSSITRFAGLIGLGLAACGQRSDAQSRAALPEVDACKIVSQAEVEAAEGWKVDSTGPGAAQFAGSLRESLSVLLTGTEILHHHGETLSESERIAQRDAMLAAVARLAEALKEREETPRTADF